MEESLDEILVEILQHLSSVPLHNAMQVCKRWNETISTRSILKDKIILKIFFINTAEALEKSKSFPYKSIYLAMGNISEIRPQIQLMAKEFDANIKEIFTVLGNDLKVLKIENIIRSLPMLLVMTPNLTRLSLSNVDTNHRQLRNYPNEESVHDFGNRQGLIMHGGAQGNLFGFGNQLHVNPRPWDIFPNEIMNRYDQLARHLNPYAQDLVQQQHIIYPRHRRRHQGIGINFRNPYQAGPVILGLDHPIVMQINQPRNPARKSDLLRSYPNVPIVKLKELKFLEVKNVKKVLCWIEAPNLKTFIIHDALNCDGTEDILMSTEKLENLVIDQFVTSYFENHEQFPFKLKKFEIKLINEAQLRNQNERFVYNFIKFLKSQKGSLKQLKMSFNTVNSDIILILNCINSYLNLSNFSISFKLDNFIDNSSTASNSVNGIMSGYLAVLNNFKNIITHCENVTSLDMNFNMYIETEVLNHLAESMPNLKSLSIHPFFTKVSSSTVFENLESLKITKLREGPHTATWYEMAMTCPNLKELSLVDEVFEISPMKLRMVLDNARNLKVLNLTGLLRFEISEEFLRVFMDENVKVWRINVHAKMSSEEFQEKVRILTENSNVQTVLHQI